MWWPLSRGLEDGGGRGGTKHPFLASAASLLSLSCFHSLSHNNSLTTTTTITSFRKSPPLPLRDRGTSIRGLETEQNTCTWLAIRLRWCGLQRNTRWHPLGRRAINRRQSHLAGQTINLSPRAIGGEGCGEMLCLRLKKLT
ncbi:hypothetical protein ASPZODRAFT_535476 [Penicilliopsis zonata CBS 506.65]|uniref:Uncharacterized protein n=1 Tax=Penicilliopsis zonata CBS 506.65 TaxID=1073090 RepID=A0A1L9SF54_9EURO|nr:hypothetical protein ASPZODRAFT_535476 [Penicilliopsis zonata CBS 506.65]OJJ45850.1 hypothetical protein ASPZODRAFT_535476 [Penicilliopsis zonata CBS 506.65]